MNKPKLLAALVLFLLSGLLVVAGCRPIDPKTYVMGAVSCGPEKGDNKCTTCMKQTCCAEYQACANDAPCPCWVAGRRMAIRPADRLVHCGPQNDAYKALAACLDRCAACPQEEALDRHVLLGKPAPEIDAEVVGGEGPKTIREARGKVAIVDFWATWCGPCKKSFPKYQALVDRFRGDVVVLALSVDDPENMKAEKLVDFAKDQGVRFSILWDRGRRTNAAYAPPPGLPATFLIDRRGMVRHVHGGESERERTRITTDVEKLVAEAFEGLPKSPHEQGVPPP